MPCDKLDNLSRNHFTVLQDSEVKSTYPTPRLSDITQLQKEASVLLENEVQAYEKGGVLPTAVSYHQKWVQCVLKSVVDSVMFPPELLNIVFHLDEDKPDSSTYLYSIFYTYFLVRGREKSSDSQWLKSVVSSGTLKDKVAALTVQVQVSSQLTTPLFCLGIILSLSQTFSHAVHSSFRLFMWSISVHHKCPYFFI